ncbi:glycoside hydrolase/phage tail family protein [uncultured Tateyamaria sp.]|uniref:baseplate multidomain protein megatron n=1 Tax=Tateyamaria sp. 1078 TaxID=3417464 RepID=UPI00262CAD1A|nr:glycoside hydrolase/phage tail family protein [uncultured Tateyamaria sp.]
MATVVLSAAGAAIGGSIGGTLAGLSSVAIGRAVGATLGRVIDQRLMGQGSSVVEHGKIDRFRLTNSGEGNAISQLYGRMRMAGQVIWASDFLETTNTTTTGGGGKGAPATPKTTTTSYSYSVSVALAVCEGEIVRIGRVWADGEELARDDLNMRVYTGTKDQLPDPLMEAVEGQGLVPAYRGTAYVVIEDLNLERFGNRVPQFSFEVVRPEQPEQADADQELTRALQGVALMPGSGEYALATTTVNYADNNRGRWSANVNTPAGVADFKVSLDALNDELPNCEAASLIVSWFGDDLRCGDCTLRPKVVHKDAYGENMAWTSGGIDRAQALQVERVDDRPIYGGTPADLSIIEAIEALQEAGKAVMFYPFILMDQMDGNALPDPFSDALTQPRLPWRGRITLSKAAGVDGSPDGTAVAEAEVDAFFGTVTAADFSATAMPNQGGYYTGPAEEWSFSRFILHYAALCRAAGGVEAFCIGSEMRGMTQIRAEANRFVFVEKLVALAAEVRAILPDAKISYAADWSEYFGFQPQDGTGDRFFHLDPLWADDNIDFIAIDNYMPLSDWRDGEDHLDAVWDDIYNLEYLQANVAGGEGYDWFYHSPEAAAAQIRTPITDDVHGEPWVWRYKDIRNWWDNPHHERVSGVRADLPTAWEPRSKPVWFTEYGCAAVDKATNQPNKFLDQKSSESSLPSYSNGARDDLIQRQYLRAMNMFWKDTDNNPQSDLYDGPMVDMSRAFVWAWDARPYPFFPNAVETWSDGENYPRGHWINGRTSSRSLASVVREVCARAGLTDLDTSELYGTVRGYVIDDVSDARSALQPLMLRYGFDAIERDGLLRFVMRSGRDAIAVDPEALAISPDLDGRTEQARESEAELAGRVRLRFVETDGNFDVLSEEAVLPDDATHAVSASELPLALTRPEGRQVVERWLAEARIARDTVRLALPPSQIGVGAGDVIQLPADQFEGSALFRVDRVEMGEMQLLEGVRIEPDVYTPAELSDELASVNAFVPPVPLTSAFLDLPLLTGDEVPHAPHLAVTGTPWPGSVAVYQSSTDSDFALNTVLAARASVGFTQTELFKARAGLVDRGAHLEVQMMHGTLASVSDAALLNGANLVAIGDGSPDGWELVQFRDAELLAPGRYILLHRLRGQLGTDALVPDVWPVGSWVVSLNGAPQQIDLLSSLRRVAQTYRIGPARRSLDDPSYEQVTYAFDGNGLRPYAPVHLSHASTANGLKFSWIRRTRIDGDSWDLPDVPLGEESETYTVRVTTGAGTLREETVTQAEWVYEDAARAADGVGDIFDVSVAQNSARYGIGPFRSLSVDLT